MIRIAIIDDEQSVINNIKKIIELSDYQLEITGTADSVKSGIQLLDNTRPDLVLLDIDLNDGTGFDLLQQVQNTSFKLIFVTAHHEYALRAFKYSALDFIVKPIDPDELLIAFEKAMNVHELEKLKQQMDVLFNNIRHANQEPSKIVLKTTDSMHIANIQDIVRCESDRNYTIFYFSDGKKIMVSKTLKEYESILSNKTFFRVHHSHLVNLNNIMKYEKGKGGYIVMNDGSSVPVAVRKKDRLLQILETL